MRQESELQLKTAEKHSGLEMEMAKLGVDVALKDQVQLLDRQPAAAVACSSAPPGPLVANNEGEAQGMPCRLCQVDFADRDDCDVTYDVPAACDGQAGKTCPLVFILHGTGGGIQNTPATVGPAIHATTRTTNFIGVYPMGSDKGGGVTGWNTGASDIGEGVDDAGFIKGILDKFRFHFGWNGRAYCFGNSNGAAMCQRIAVNGLLGFTGVAPVSSQLMAQPPTTPEQTGPDPYNYNWPSPQACTVPIAYISFSGLQDPTVPYQGGSAVGVQMSSVPETNEAWRRNNGCQPTTSTKAVPAEAMSGATTAVHSVWDECEPNAPTEHYMVIDGTHESALTIAGKDLVTSAVDFFDRVENYCRAGSQRCPPVGVAQSRPCNTR
jgi:poly(3-hydroxybutyrate) depolymerase